MPFQVQDVAQCLAGVGQLTLQQPSFFKGAFLVTNHVPFQRVKQELNAFLDAVQLCQGLLLFLQFFALKRGFVEPYGGVSDVKKPLFQPRQLTWSRGGGVVRRTGLVDGPSTPQASQHQGCQRCDPHHEFTKVGLCRRRSEARWRPTAVLQKMALRFLRPHVLLAEPRGRGGFACVAQPRVVSRAGAWL